MSFESLPSVCSWQHQDARTGFEVTFFHHDDTGIRVHGSTAATEAGTSWIVDYDIRLDESWLTRSARIRGHSGQSTVERTIETDGSGNWWVDGDAAPALRGCLDLDLEASAMTNTFPVHRLDFTEVGRAEAAPAAYVRAVDLTVSRLDQTYARATQREYDYAAPEFDFACRLTYDQHGLILDYPGLATRIQ